MVESERYVLSPFAVTNSEFLKIYKSFGVKVMNKKDISIDRYHFTIGFELLSFLYSHTTDLSEVFQFVPRQDTFSILAKDIFREVTVLME